MKITIGQLTFDDPDNAIYWITNEINSIDRCLQSSQFLSYMQIKTFKKRRADLTKKLKQAKNERHNIKSKL